MEALMALGALGTIGSIVGAVFLLKSKASTGAKIAGTAGLAVGLTASVLVGLLGVALWSWSGGSGSKSNTNQNNNSNFLFTANDAAPSGPTHALDAEPLDTTEALAASSPGAPVSDPSAASSWDFDADDLSALGVDPTDSASLRSSQPRHASLNGGASSEDVDASASERLSGAFSAIR